MRGICRDCGVEHQFDEHFYVERSLAFPNRCYSCRASRKENRIPGTVAFVHPRGFGFIEGEDGTRYYVEPYDLGTDAASAQLQTGQRVEFAPAIGNPHPRARRVRVIKESERTAS